MDPEENHGHILGGSNAPWAETTLTEVCVPISGGDRMILGAGEFLPLEDPAIEYLPKIIIIQCTWSLSTAPEITVCWRGRKGVMLSLGLE